MNIDVKQLSLKVSDRYPYTHRVQVSGDAADKVTTWLKESEIPHYNPVWGVFYLDPTATNMLVLRWS
jgi:hypothetical protein